MCTQLNDLNKLTELNEQIIAGAKYHNTEKNKKQDIPKQWKKILQTNRGSWHENIPTTECKRSWKILEIEYDN